jgi:aldehyde:ferredoxin oxidoreductase
MNVVTVDLGRPATRLHPLDEKVAGEYIGGRGVTIRMLFDMGYTVRQERKELLHLLERNAILTGFSRAPEDTDPHA